MCLIYKIDDHYILTRRKTKKRNEKIEMPGFDPERPGELNRFADPNAELCQDFNLTGK